MTHLRGIELLQCAAFIYLSAYRQQCDRVVLTGPHESDSRASTHLES